MNEVSCIVVNYNNEKYLKECLNSLVNQTKKIDEIIVADDCSSDGSISIIACYAKKHDNIVPIYNKTNLGVTKNRDNAIRQSTGKFITTLDSDDCFHPTKIENEYSTILNKPDAIVASDTVDINEVGEVYNLRHTKKFCLYEKNKRIQHLVGGAGSIVPRDVMLSRVNYIRTGGLDTRFPLYEDWEFKLRLSCIVDSWLHSGSRGTYYRHTSKGLSSQKKLNLAYYHLKAVLYNLRNAKNKTSYVSAILKWLFIKTPIVFVGRLLNRDNRYTKHIHKPT